MRGAVDWTTRMQNEVERLSGTYHDVLSSPQSDIVFSHLLTQAALLEATQPGRRWPYPSAQHLVLDEGREFLRYMEPKEARRGSLQRAFLNAAELVASDPERYAYVEGYAFSGVMPVHHAWAFDRDFGSVMDPTWPEAWRRDRRVEFQYVGIPIATDYVLDAFRTGSSSVLDDWKRDHPLLTGAVHLEEWLHPWFEPIRRSKNTLEEVPALAM